MSAFAAAGLLTALVVAIVGPLLTVPGGFAATGRPSCFQYRSPVWSVNIVALPAKINGDPAEVAERAARFSHGRSFTFELNRFQADLVVEISLQAWRFYACGWPATCFHAWRMYEPQPGVTAEGPWLVEIPSLQRDERGRHKRVVIPLGPQLAGIAINTATFGAGWWAIFGLAALTRSIVRHRRGLCVRCGYSRTGLAAGGACPECGKPVNA